MDKALLKKLKTAYKATSLMPFVSPSFYDNDHFRLNQELYKQGKFETYIQNEGFKAQVFEPHLHSILTSKNIPTGKASQTFDGTNFQRAYVVGFRKGNEYFVSHYPKELFFVDPVKYKRSLHVCYFHKEPIKKKKGWVSWETGYPMNLSESIVEEFGFFAGIVYEMKKVIDQHPGEFEDFKTQCALSSTVRKEDPRKGGLTWEEVIMIYNYRRKAGEEQEIRTGADWKRLYGQAASNACSRVENNNVSIKNFEKVVQALTGSKGQQFVINDMNRHLSL